MTCVVSCANEQSLAPLPFIQFVSAPADLTSKPGSTVVLNALAETNSKVDSVRYIWEKLEADGKVKDISAGKSLTITLPTPQTPCDQVQDAYHVIAIAGELSTEHTFTVTSFDRQNCETNLDTLPGLISLADAAIEVDPGEDVWVAPGDILHLKARVSNGAEASFLWEQLDGAGGGVSFSNTPDVEFVAPQLAKNCDSKNIVLQVTATSGSVTKSRTVSVYVAAPMCVLTTADGLIANETTKILIRDQDPLVVGTERGLSHYDGKKWDNFTRGGSNRELLYITALAEAPDQTVWVGNANEAFVFYEGRGLERLTSDLLWESELITNSTGLQGRYVTQIAFDRDKQPGFTTVTTKSDLATVGGATRGSLPSFSARTSLISDQGVYATIRDPNGYRWFATGSSGSLESLRASSGIFVYDGISKIATFTGTEWEGVGTTRLSDNRDIRAMVIDARGDVWIGLHSGSGFYQKGGLVKFTPNAGESLKGIWSRPPELFPKSNRIRAIAPDGRGNIWVATSEGLVRRYASGAVETLTKSTANLPSNDIRDVYYDPETRFVWAATAGGIVRIVEPLFVMALIIR